MVEITQVNASLDEAGDENACLIVGKRVAKPSECGESARFPDYVREYRLWGYFRFSCHTVADDGPLYEE